VREMNRDRSTIKFCNLRTAGHPNFRENTMTVAPILSKNTNSRFRYKSEYIFQDEDISVMAFWGYTILALVHEPVTLIQETTVLLKM
jgi:hypothetical protein